MGGVMAFTCQLEVGQIFTLVVLRQLPELIVVLESVLN
jgi:hypothetical protein